MTCPPRVDEGLLRRIGDAARDRTTDPVMLIGGDGTVLALNRAALALIDGTEATHLGVHVSTIVEGYSRERVAERTALARAVGTIRTELAFRGPHGPSAPYDLVTTFVQIDGAEYFLSVGRDMSERRRVERLLRENESLLNDLLNAMVNAVLLVDRDGRITYANPAACALFDLPLDALLAVRRGSTPPWRLSRPDGTQLDAAESPIEVAFREQRVVRTPVLKLHTASGHESFITAQVAPILDSDGTLTGVVATMGDITALRSAQDRNISLQEQIAEIQRMEAVGRLAGGIAHDFNNLLTAILAAAELTLYDLPPGDAHFEDLLGIREAAGRGAVLAKQLLSFARKQVIDPRRIDLTPFFAEIERLVRPLLGESVMASITVAPATANVLVDPTQLQQVIVNLALNARDAMERGGRLEISARTIKATDRVPDDTARPAGRWVLIAVRDSGHGIPDEIRDKIFDPFFTTKPIGIGTGLGLPTARGIIEQAGGVLSLTSAPGEGTTFRIWLPPNETGEPPSDPKDREETPRGSGRILVIEDDALVRTFTVRTLTSLGYEAISAPDGATALEIAADPTVIIDGVVSDVVMPGMSGKDVAIRLHELRPTLPVLFVSGYADDVIVHHGILEPNVKLLGKPYTATELGRAVHALLNPAD
ncbi:MAG: PAS domain-containing protein [Gemmatimonadaceae bacterium]|nr:PAS domain-containing protein [Gemmatimonadaceae bacterium]